MMEFTWSDVAESSVITGTNVLLQLELGTNSLAIKTDLNLYTSYLR